MSKKTRSISQSRGHKKGKASPATTRTAKRSATVRQIGVKAGADLGVPPNPPSRKMRGSDRSRRLGP